MQLFCSYIGAALDYGVLQHKWFWHRPRFFTGWFELCMLFRGRSQLSTFMKAYTAYARGEGVWDHRTLFPWKSTFICNHWQWIIKYCTCLQWGQYAHICRSFMYNNTFEALFLTSKCTKRGFLWTQTVAPHHGFCKAAQRRYRFFPLELILVHIIAPNCEYFTNHLMQCSAIFLQ